MAHIEHIAIWTKNLEALKAFYETYFQAQAGDRYTNANTGFASYFLTFASGARLELMCMPGIPESSNDIEPQFTGYIHLAISVGAEEQVDALTARLGADGYRVMGAPRRTGDGYYESVVLDPDGNRVEITI
jgi:lactoylglutathione lyase